MTLFGWAHKWLGWSMFLAARQGCSRCFHLSAGSGSSLRPGAMSNRIGHISFFIFPLRIYNNHNHAHVNISLLCSSLSQCLLTSFISLCYILRLAYVSIQFLTFIHLLRKQFRVSRDESDWENPLTHFVIYLSGIGIEKTNWETKSGYAECRNDNSNGQRRHI